MGRYHTYSEYEPIEEESFTTLPSHWSTRKVRFVLQDGANGIKIGPFGSALRLEDMVEKGVRVYGQENVIKSDFTLGKRRISEEKFSDMEVYEVFSDDLLITMMGTSGKCELVPEYAERGIIDSHLLRLRVNEKEINPAFFRLLIDESQEVKYQIKVLGKGSIMHGLNSSIVKSLMLPLPVRTEQDQILNFLDHETAKIDTLIDKQQQLIKLLKEKRQAVISHAVTKGLNPDAPMKDSGVEWLGEVPRHWDVLRIKHLLRPEKGAIKTGPFGSHLKGSEMQGGEHKVINQRNVIDDDFGLGDFFVDYSKYRELIGFRIFPEDILVTTRGTIGRTAIFPKNLSESILHPCLMRLQIDQSKYLNELVTLIIQDASYFLEQLKILSNATTIDVIYSEILKNVMITLPPCHKEQENVQNFVRKETGKINILIKKSQNVISLMKERRTALISAAVTGKIDVRNWKPAQSETSTEATT